MYISYQNFCTNFDKLKTEPRSRWKPPYLGKGKLAINDDNLRINYYRGEQARLLAEVVKLQDQNSQIQKIIKSVRADIKLRTADLNRVGIELDNSIHNLFAKAINRPKLGKFTKIKIELYYLNLQSEVLSRRQVATVEDFPPEDHAQASAHNYRWVNQEPTPATIDPERLKQIRSVYLRLANLYHPDKYPNSPYHLELMQQINAAYDQGDLVTLLKIEEQSTIIPNSPRAITADLIDQVRYLNQQLVGLNYHHRWLENSNEYRISLSKDRDLIGDAIVKIVEQIDYMRSIESMLKMFCDRQLSVKDLLSRIKLH